MSPRSMLSKVAKQQCAAIFPHTVSHRRVGCSSARLTSCITLKCDSIGDEPLPVRSCAKGPRPHGLSCRLSKDSAAL